MRNFNKQQFIEEKKKEFESKFVNKTIKQVDTSNSIVLYEWKNPHSRQSQEVWELFEQALNEAITKAYKQGVKHLDELLP